MFFRFAAAIGLFTVLSLVAIALEKQNLHLKRVISLQHYRLEILQEQRSRLILEVEELEAPTRLLEEWRRRHEPRVQTIPSRSNRKAPEFSSASLSDRQVMP